MAFAEKLRHQPWFASAIYGLCWLGLVLLFLLSIWLIGRDLSSDSGSRAQLAVAEITAALSQPMGEDSREGLKNGMRSLLRDKRLGLLYIRVRRADGRPLAVAGRFEAWTTPVLSAPSVRRWLYATLSADRDLELQQGNRRIGSVTYGLAWFARDTEGGFSQWAGLLGILLSVPLWIWVSIRWALSLSSQLNVSQKTQSSVGEQRQLLGSAEVDIDDYWAALGLALIVVNRETRVQKVNPAAEKILNKRSAQLLGSPLSACLYLVGSNGKTWVPPLPVAFNGHGIDEAGLTLVNQTNKSQQKVDVSLWAVRNKKNAVTGAIVGLKKVVNESAAVAMLRSQVAVANVALNTIDKAVLGITKRGSIGYCNDGATRLLGRSESDLRSLGLEALFPADANDGRNIASVLVGTEAVLCQADGSQLPVDIKVRDLPDTDDFVLIIDPVFGANELATIPSATDLMLQHIVDLVFIIDEKSQTIVKSSKNIAQEWGYSPEKIIDRKVTDLFTDLSPERLQGYQQQLQADPAKPVAFEATLKTVSGGECLSDCETALVEHQGAMAYLIVVKPQHQERTEEASIQDDDRLVFLAYYDSLTSLPSRLLFMDRLQQAIKTADRTETKLCVATVDIAGISEVNRQLGVAVGDQLLKAIATRLRHKLDENVVCSRVGSSFVLAVPLDEAVANTNQLMNLLEAASAAVRMEPASVHLKFYLGYTVFPDHSRDAEQLLLQAFRATNAASEEALIVGYDPALIQEEEGGLDEAQAVGLAIGQNSFALQYTPVTSGGSGSLHAVMVNLDWSGIPDIPQEVEHFSALVLRSGLAADLAIWMVRETCQATRGWFDAGMANIPIVLDLSLLEPFREETANRVLAIVADYDQQIENFIVAVSADALHADSRWLSLFIQAGCRVWLRQFGLDGRMAFDANHAPHFTDLALEVVDALPNAEAQVEKIKKMLGIAKQHDCQIVMPAEVTVTAKEYLNSLGCVLMLEGDSAEVSAKQLGLRLARSEIKPL